ncbi:MAG: ABC transporter ATP-binding protein [Candidatus Limnocylindrales bacterium]
MNSSATEATVTKVADTAAAGEPTAGPGEPTAGPGEPAIRAVGLVKRFGPVVAVDGMTFDLAPGRIYGLLGPNGSGKTTLIRLLTGMTKATEGHAEVLGVRMPSRVNLARIGYMTQSDGIYPALTAVENARFFAAAYGVHDDAQVMDALTLVELADRAKTVAGTLSGGLRRRLSLACVLVHRPPVLFLDEPTVGVDPLLRVQFWGHFRSLADAGTTIVISSHVMDEADRCDELLFVRAGKVIARGTGAQLRTEADTDDLEAAFLRFAGEGAVAA